MFKISKIVRQKILWKLLTSVTPILAQQDQNYRVFGTGHLEDNFVSTGFRNWKKGLVNVDVDALRSEMMVAKNCLTRTKLNFDLEEIKLVVGLKVYPNLYTLLSLSLTIPISSSTCERSFSAMRKIKNWLRTSMHQDRFSNASVIYIEKDISGSLKNEDILNIFAMSNHRLQL
ncbi:hypothetical protein QTP88_006733 [Uroleucon formosanum]